MSEFKHVKKPLSYYVLNHWNVYLVVHLRSSIKLHKCWPKKILNIMNKNWGSPIHNGLNLMGIHVNAILEMM